VCVCVCVCLLPFLFVWVVVCVCAHARRALLAGRSPGRPGARADGGACKRKNTRPHHSSRGLLSLSLTCLSAAWAVSSAPRPTPPPWPHHTTASRRVQVLHSAAHAPTMAPALALPRGWSDAKYVLLLQAFLGEFVQGARIRVCVRVCARARPAVWAKTKGLPSLGGDACHRGRGLAGRRGDGRGDDSGAFFPLSCPLLSTSFRRPHLWLERPGPHATGPGRVLGRLPGRWQR